MQQPDRRSARFLLWCRSTPGGVLLAVIGVSALCGALAYPQAWVVFAAALTLLLLGVVLPGLSVWGATVRVSFTVPRCRIGEAVELHVSIRNRLPLPLSGLELVGLPISPGGTGTPLPVLAPLARRELRLTVTPARRGVLPRGQITVLCAFPLGLRQVTRTVVSGSTLLVWPTEAPVQLPELSSSPRHGESLLAGRRPGTHGEPTGVRPYRRGDAIREVHWRQTARHGRLIVRERQAPASARAVLLLDADPRSYDTPSHREHAISVATGLLRGFSLTAVLVDLMVGTDLLPAGTALSIPSPSPSGGGAVAQAFDFLARIPDDSPGLAESLLRLPSNTSEPVIVTSPRTAARLRGAAPRSARWVEVADNDTPVPTSPEAAQGGTTLRTGAATPAGVALAGGSA